LWQWRYLGRIAIRRWQERAEAVPVFPNALSAEPLGFFAGTVHALGIKGGIYRPGARGPLRAQSSGARELLPVGFVFHAEPSPRQRGPSSTGSTRK
jgi:hypothetical protein